MKKSAGILLYRMNHNEPEFFLVHPGGPFWKNKDEGSWSIPKGEFTDEEPLRAAIREFSEETGVEINGEFITLNPVRQKSGKTVYAFALEKNIDLEKIISNTFEMEWPPRSGRMKNFPEIDKAGWFNEKTAKEKINHAQIRFIDHLILILESK